MQLAFLASNQSKQKVFAEDMIINYSRSLNQAEKKKVSLVTLLQGDSTKSVLDDEISINLLQNTDSFIPVKYRSNGATNQSFGAIKKLKIDEILPDERSLAYFNEAQRKRV